MHRRKPWVYRPLSQHVMPFQEKHFSGIIELDKEVSGENRERLLTEHLINAQVYFKENSVQGFYLPDLKEGLIIADTQEAGTALTAVKCSTIEKITLPSENDTGIKFLEDNGFTRTAKKGTRMVYGEAIHWEPKKLYSRIGGNLG